MRCEDCGCTDHNPCIDVIAGGPCSWACDEPPLCSVCLFERGVVLGIIQPGLTRDLFEGVPVVDLERPRIEMA